MVQENIPTKAGRPAHKPTAETQRAVAAMAACGLTQEQIGKAVGLSHVSLRKHYSAELEQAAAKGLGEVAANLFRLATGDGPSAVTAAIFILKCKGGWKPPAETAITIDQRPAPPPTIKLSPEQDAHLKELVANARERVRMPGRDVPALAAG